MILFRGRGGKDARASVAVRGDWEMGIFDERKPDKEGYLGFKDAIKNGNEGLMERASELYFKEDTPQSELAQYASVYIKEISITSNAQYSTRRHIAEALPRLKYLKDPALRERTWARFERLSKACDSAIKTASQKYDELNGSDLKSQTVARQLASPHETQSQSWFNVKRDIVSDHSWYLGHLKVKFENAVETQIMIAFDKQTSRGRSSDASDRAAAALDHARQASARFKQHQHGKAENDNDRER